MEKIKLLKVSKNERRSEYAFSREQVLFEIVRGALQRLGFGKNDWLLAFGRPWDEKTEEPLLDKEDDIMSKEYDERIDYFINENYSVDIIFFSEKVVLIFNYNKDKQQEISKAFDNLVEEEN